MERINVREIKGYLIQYDRQVYLYIHEQFHIIVKLSMIKFFLTWQKMDASFGKFIGNLRSIQPWWEALAGADLSDDQ